MNQGRWGDEFFYVIRLDITMKMDMMKTESLHLWMRDRKNYN